MDNNSITPIGKQGRTWDAPVDGCETRMSVVTPSLKTSCLAVETNPLRFEARHREQSSRPKCPASTLLSPPYRVPERCSRC